MLNRIITSLIGLPVLIFITAMGGITLKIGIGIMALMGMYEFYNATCKKSVSILGYIFAVAYILFIDVMSVNQVLVLNNAFIVSVLVCLVIFYKKVNIIDCAVTILGFFYVAVLLTSVYLVRERIYGEFFVWLIFISAWGCDTGAYFCGLKFGKRKLAPELSPKKTVEGAIGGIITATLLGLIYGFAVNSFINREAPNIVFLSAISCGIGSVFAQLGDLTASAIKRFTNTKDFGRIFPGHGGILDRFDSVLFTAPGIYLATYVLLWLRG